MIRCQEFTGYEIDLILKRMNKFFAGQGVYEIINIETVRSKARTILIRVWWRLGRSHE